MHKNGLPLLGGVAARLRSSVKFWRDGVQAWIEDNRESGPRLQFDRERLQWQTDHVGVRTGNAFDELITILLNRVSAGFIEWIDARQVTANFYRIQRPESNRSALAENALTVGAQEHQANRSHNLMRAALEFLQHSVGDFECGRFAKKRRVEAYQGIRAEDQCIRIFLCDRARFSVSINLRGFPDAQLIVMNFRHCAGNNFEIERQLTQQLRATRRSRGENDRRHN